MRLSKYLKQKRIRKVSITLLVIFLSLGIFVVYFIAARAPEYTYTWELVNSEAPWDAKSHACSIEFQDKLWLFGGNRTNPDPPDIILAIPGALNQPTRDVWNSEDGNTWNKVEADPLPERFGCQLLVHEDKLWSFGQGVWSSPDGYNWNTVSEDPPLNEYSYSVNILDNRFFLLGGNDADIFKREVWSSDDGANWQQVMDQAPWPARAGHSLATTVFDDKLWLIGGLIDDPDRAGAMIPTNDVWYTSNGRDWIKVDTDDSWPGASSHTVFSYGNYIWVFGGRRGDKVNELWRSSDGIAWEMLEVKNEQWYPRDDYAFAVYDDKIWVIGGNEHRNQEPKLNDVWAAELPR